MHNSAYRVVLADYLSPEGVQRAVASLDEIKLSPKGEAVIVSVIIYAKEKNRKLADIFAVCNKERESTWRLQDPAVRGDPDAAEVVGAHNRDSLQNICNSLGIDNPNERDQISAGHLIVRTHGGSIYRFSPANEKGERTVTKDGDHPLDFSKCKIVFLSQGRRMVLLILEPEGIWRTSAIELISFI